MIAIVFNPTARGNKATAFRARLNIATRAALAAKHHVVLKPSRSAGDAVLQARAAVEQGFTTIVAAGGDGTVNEVVNGIALVPDGPQRARLGVLPLGTINVFAKELQVPGDFEAGWQLLLRGTERQVDLGMVEFSEAASAAAATRRWFVQMGGAGLDSLSLERVSWALKKKIGSLAYIWAGLQTLLTPLPMVEAEVDGKRVCGQLALIGNGRYYGGRWVVFPSARLDDGLLDLAMVQQVSTLRFLRQFAALARGRFGGAPGLIHWQGREIVLRAAVTGGTGIPFHVEGDNMGRLPARFSMDARALRVVAP